MVSIVSKEKVAELNRNVFRQLSRGSFFTVSESPSSAMRVFLVFGLLDRDKVRVIELSSAHNVETLLGESMDLDDGVWTTVYEFDERHMLHMLSTGTAQK